MKTFAVPLKERLRSIDYVLLLLVLAMTFMSLLTLFGDRDSSGGTRRFLMQSGASLVGLCAVYALSVFDYGTFLKYFTVPLLAGSILLMLITVIFGDGPTSGTTNKCWLYFGSFSVQPSEFVKIFFIMTFSKHLEVVREKINHPLSLLPLLAHGGIIIGLVLLTGDLGSALIFMAAMAVMLFAAGLSLWYFAAAIAVVVVSVPFLWSKLLPYQQNRILAGFQPEVDPTDVGYQAIKSRAAIAAGGFRGSGIFGGTYYHVVPAHTTDCFFSMVCEKFGFIGAFCYIVMIFLLVLRLLHIAHEANQKSGTFICVGISAIIIAQAVENIGMCLGILPVVGITLPFLSYGGSSMLASYLYIGMAESVVAHNRKAVLTEISL